MQSFQIIFSLNPALFNINGANFISRRVILSMEPHLLV
ncbi:hypothetical protein NOC27_3395 [Nitrosococcus oceani AFC27]|nr:hypothetical protein NOC27_3395 [Nitrosococcus oceani AFC27]